ncbi:MAG: hypothetical protein VXY34_09815, partial [Bdellovibrionota bacterium]|nr:hypothetical protein [Bdellovibrionota bacterium]
KLSLENRSWYENNVEGCTQCGLRESVLGEEATALYSSVLEHVPGKVPAKEMKNLLQEIHSIVQENIDQKNRGDFYSMNGYSPVGNGDPVFGREFR